MIGRLASALKTADEQNTSSPAGFLSREEFTTALTEFFPLKLSENVEKLVQAAATELDVATGDRLQYENLFTEVHFVIC